MAISKRLKAIAKYIEGYETLADIACDHGYLGIYAVEEYNLKEVLLTDINPMPLASAVKNVESKNLSNIISTKLGNGLEPLTKDYEVITICGIGGMLLKEILEEGLERAKNAKRLILCPNSDLYEVRKFLADNDFDIIMEEVIHDYKYYQIIVANYAGQAPLYSEIQLKYGPKLLENISIEFIMMYKNRLDLYEKELNHVLDLTAKEKLLEKINEIKTILGNNL